MRRPFAGIHWILPVAILLLSEFSFYTRKCVEGPRYFEVILATVTICMAFWASRTRMGPVQGMGKALAIVGGALADLLMLFLLVILFSIPAPALDCGTRSKIWLSKNI